MTNEPFTPEITNDDKLWAALGYPVSIIALVVLFMEDKKARPFIKYHAVQSLAFNIILGVVGIVFSTVTLGFGAFCLPLLWFVTFWPAYEAYQGNYMELPFITDFIKNQGWV